MTTTTRIWSLPYTTYGDTLPITNNNYSVELALEKDVLSLFGHASTVLMLLLGMFLYFYLVIKINKDYWQQFLIYIFIIFLIQI